MKTYLMFDKKDQSSIINLKDLIQEIDFHDFTAKILLNDIRYITNDNYLNEDYSYEDLKIDDIYYDDLEEKLYILPFKKSFYFNNKLLDADYYFI